MLVNLQIMPAKTIKVSTKIPIYGYSFYLIFTDDIKRDLIDMGEVFDIIEGEKLGGALSKRTNFNFGIFFTYNHLSHGCVGHETFHMTHYIMEYIGQKWDMDNQECFAQMNTWLSDYIYSIIEKKKIKMVEGWTI